MPVWALLAALVWAGQPGTAQETAPPPRPLHLASGLAATLIEAFLEPQADLPEVWLRARFLAPGIAGGAVGFEDVGADLMQLCREQVLPGLAARGEKAEVAVVSLSAAPIAFGQTSPDVTQYFEAYRIADGDCILEGF